MVEYIASICQLVKNENEFFQTTDIEKEDSKILETENSCPSEECWEMIEGKCSIKTERENCNLLLHCDPHVIDFRFDQSQLFGAKASEEKLNIDCPVQNSLNTITIGNTVTPVHENIDKMWRYRKCLYFLIVFVVRNL